MPGAVEVSLNVRTVLCLDTFACLNAGMLEQSCVLTFECLNVWMFEQVEDVTGLLRQQGYVGVYNIPYTKVSDSLLFILIGTGVS